jgi:hypothetical protein
MDERRQNVSSISPGQSTSHRINRDDPQLIARLPHFGVALVSHNSTDEKQRVSPGLARCL